MQDRQDRLIDIFIGHERNGEACMRSVTMNSGLPWRNHSSLSIEQKLFFLREGVMYFFNAVRTLEKMGIDVPLDLHAKLINAKEQIANIIENTDAALADRHRDYIKNYISERDLTSTVLAMEDSSAQEKYMALLAPYASQLNMAAQPVQGSKRKFQEPGAEQRQKDVSPSKKTKCMVFNLFDPTEKSEHDGSDDETKMDQYSRPFTGPAQRNNY
jgi:hypothetical protein